MNDEAPVLVDMKGQPIATAPEANAVRATLMALLEEMDAGREIERVYILYTAPDPQGRDMVNSLSRDSGITCAEAVCMLEVEKHRLMIMMLGG